MIKIRFIIQLFSSLVGSTDSSTTMVKDSIPTLDLQDGIFKLAELAAELIGSRGWRRKKIGSDDDEFVKAMKIADINFEKEEKKPNSKNDLDSYSTWKLDDNIKEIEGRNAVKKFVKRIIQINNDITEYKVKEGKSEKVMFDREDGITRLCSGIENMTERDFIRFLQYCFSFLYDDYALFKLRDLIVRRIKANSYKILPLEESILQRLENWIKKNYRGFAPITHRCRCRKNNTFKYPFIESYAKSSSRYIMLYATRSNWMIKMRISPIEISDVPRAMPDFINYRLEVEIPIREIAFNNKTFAGINYPFSIFWDNTPKYLTRINFFNCDFKDNVFRIHPEEDRKFMSNITSLKIKSGWIKNIEAAPELLENIEVFETSWHRFSEIPDAIFSMKNLKKLIMTGGEKLVQIHPRLYTLVNLRILKIHVAVFEDDKNRKYYIRRSLKIVPMEMLSALKNLEVLCLSGVHIVNREKINFVQENLKYLAFDRCKVVKLPVFIYNSAHNRPCLPNLKVLRLINDRLENNIAMEHYSSTSRFLLQALYFFSSLEPVRTVLYDKLPELTELEISDAHLHEIPGWVFNFNNSLKKLILKNNLIENLPVELKTFYKLEVLDLNRDSYFIFNYRDEIRDTHHDVSIPSQVKELYLSGHRFVELPKEICELKELEILDLANNQLIGLPDTIQNLSKLSALILLHNQFDTFPKELKGHPNLKSLDMKQNKLTELPTWILCANVYLPKIQEISVEYNRFPIDYNIILKRVDRTFQEKGAKLSY